MVKYWSDHCGTTRYGGRRGKRRRQKVRRRGLFAMIRLQQARSGRVRVSLEPAEPGFPHVSTPEAVNWCLNNRKPYHATVITNPPGARADPQAMIHLQNIRTYFQNSAWWHRVRIQYIDPWSHVAWVHPMCPVFQPIWNDMVYLRNHHGSHAGNCITVSM